VSASPQHSGTDYRPQVRPDELVAAALLAQLLEREAVPHDVAGERQHDWDLRAGDGATIAVEVTRHIDSDLVKFWTQGQHYREIDGLGGTYLVNVASTANRNELWKRLPKVLADPSPDLIDTDFANNRWHRPDGLPTPDEELLMSLGVRHIRFAPGGRSAITLTTLGGGFPAAELAVEAAMSEVEANRAKLALATDAAERHLFVWVDGSAWLANESMRDSDPPTTAAPDFGVGVDVVWIAAKDTRRRLLQALALWRAESGRPWVDWTPRLDRS
jgi:hypothetical protein